MNKIIKLFYNTCLLIILISQPILAHALAADKDSPVFVEADQAEINNKTKEGEYAGHVRVDQGSTHITASYATTLLGDDNGLLHATARGDDQAQVHYWTLREADEPEIHAYADFMEYNAGENTIYLEGNAIVKQGEDSYAAPQIEYDLINERVISAQSDQGRTTIILHPNNSNEA